MSYGVMAKPPPLSVNTVIRRTFRFRHTSSSKVLITQGDFCSVLACVNTGGAVPLATSLFAATRVHRIRIWATGVTGADSTVSITWAASGSAIAQEVSDTSVSVSVPSFVSSKPPKDHPSSFWLQPGSSTPVCFLQGPSAGSIIDVDIEGVMMDGQGPFTGCTGAPFSGIVGVIYGMPLDQSSNPAGSRVILPVGLQTFGN